MKILELLKKLDNDISYYHWYLYNNFMISDLYQNFSFTSLINWYWKPYYNTRKLKKIYIKNKTILDYAIKNHNKILNYSNTMAKLINNTAF